ncbi:hypothetical protein J4218_02515 [Candidatus Pacearchaeota archaeon]|nr:hypothetical protein [Candidatus Pacearchaeota archaeon]
MKKEQLDPIILDLSKSAINNPQESCNCRHKNLSHRHMGLLVLLVLALFLIPEKISIWPKILPQILSISIVPPLIKSVRKTQEK